MGGLSAIETHRLDEIGIKWVHFPRLNDPTQTSI